GGVGGPGPGAGTGMPGFAGMPQGAMPAGMAAPAHGGAVGGSGYGVGSPVAAGVHAANAMGRPPRYREVVREQLAHWRAAGAMPVHQEGAGVGGGADLPPGAQLLRTEDLLNVAQILQGDDS